MKISSNNYDYYNMLYSLKTLSNANSTTANTSFSQADSEADAREIPKGFDKFMEDMESIKLSDIDSMSADELKQLLEDLKTDLESNANPYIAARSTEKTNLDNLSEFDMREMLKKIQDYANSIFTYNQPVQTVNDAEQVTDEGNTEA